VIAAGMVTILAVQATKAGPISAIDPHPAGLASPAPYPPEASPAIEATHAQDPTPADAVALDNEFLTIASAGGWFDAEGIGLGVADDRSTIQIDPATCIYPDSYLGSLGRGQDNCRVFTPGGDNSETLSLPFLAVSAWALIIFAVASLYRVYRDWRARRWLSHLRARGLVPQTADWRRHAARSSRRPGSRSRSRRRSYVG
jgi:hypothetical protein